MEGGTAPRRMSCRPFWQTLQIQSDKVSDVTLAQNLITSVNPVSVVQELG